MTKAIKRIPILAFPDIDISDASALKATNAGTATPAQQHQCVQFIMKTLCMLGGISMTDDPHLTAFNEGKRFVGANILFVLNEPISKFDKQ